MKDLRRGMALERQPGIGLGHTLAIVDDLNGGAPGIYDNHVDGCGTSIDGILHQFLDDRGRTLYHLTSCYLVGYAVGKKMDDVLHFVCFCLQFTVYR